MEVKADKEAELAELAEELRLVAVLEGVVEVAVPVIELHLEPDHHQREAHHRSEKREALDAFRRHPIGLGEAPESL